MSKCNIIHRGGLKWLKQKVGTIGEDILVPKVPQMVRKTCLVGETDFLLLYREFLMVKFKIRVLSSKSLGSSNSDSEWL